MQTHQLLIAATRPGASIQTETGTALAHVCKAFINGHLTNRDVQAPMQRLVNECKGREVDGIGKEIVELAETLLGDIRRTLDSLECGPVSQPYASGGWGDTA